MKSFRESFEEDYMAYQEPYGNKKGFRIRYAYVGTWYAYKLSKEERQRCKRLIGGLCALSTACFALAASRDCELNYGGLPALFAGLSLAVFLFVWFGAVKFIASAEKITRQNFGETNMLLKLAPIVNALLLWCASGSCIVWLIRNKGPAGAAAVPLFYFFSGVCSFLVTFFYRALPWEKEKNNVWEDGSKKFIHV